MGRGAGLLSAARTFLWKAAIAAAATVSFCLLRGWNSKACISGVPCDINCLFFLIKWQRYLTCEGKLIESVVGTQWGGAMGVGAGEGGRGQGLVPPV